MSQDTTDRKSLELGDWVTASFTNPPDIIQEQKCKPLLIKRVNQLPSPTTHLKNYGVIAFKGMIQLASHKHLVPLDVLGYPTWPPAATPDGMGIP